jgi:signal transduction histidine kinase
MHLERLGRPGERSAVTMWATGADGRHVYHDHERPQNGGLSVPIIAAPGNGAAARVHPDDIHRSRELFARALARREPFQALYRIRGDSGYDQVLDVGVPRFVGERFAGFVGSAVNLSELSPDRQALSSLSHRLMHDHERQQASVARRLHEDICQRMVAVTLKMHAIVAAAEREELEETMRDLSDQLSRLAGEIIAIPDPVYRKLDLLGFAAAASSLCRDLSSRHRADIRFSSHNVPPKIPEDVALALLRVLEEAATNALRHSHSEHVTVAVTGAEGVIQLDVRDDGVGFDAEGMADSDKVGLVSMRERIRMVDGNCDIQSRSGGGTRVSARVPCADPL